jgi:hypothetical protein
MVKCFRKYLAEDRIWQEKLSLKHNHDFSIPAILETKYIGKLAFGPKFGINYREVLMCNKCHSFKICPNKGYILNTNILDNEYNIDKFLSKEQQKLPLIKGIRDKSGIENIEYIDELHFPDGYVFKRGA